MSVRGPAPADARRRAPARASRWSALLAVVARACCAARAAARAAADRHARRPRHATLQGRPSATTSASATTRSSCSCARPLAARAHLRPRAPARPGGLHLGQRAARGDRRAAGANGPCARLAKNKPVQVVYGPGTFINESGRPDPGRSSPRQQQARRPQRDASARMRPRASSRRRRAAARPTQEQLGHAGRSQLVHASSSATSLRLALQLRDHARSPQINDPTSSRSSSSTRQARREHARRRASPTSSRRRTRALIQVRLRPDLSEPSATRRRSGSSARPSRCPTGG